MTLPVSRRLPIHRRLLALTPGSRRFLVGSAVLGAVGAGLVIAQGVLLASIVADAFHGTGLDELSAELAGLLAVVAGRSMLAWLTDVVAHRSAAAVKSRLRLDLLATAVDRGGIPPIRPGALAAAAGRGIEALDAFYARYLPQIVLAGIVPLLVLVWLFGIDPWSGTIVLVTLPLVPLFAALVGAATRARVARRWRAFVELSDGFVEAVRGLPTWKVFGRSEEQVAGFEVLADRHRRETMGTLRIAFLSALALELVTMISVAVVAVAVGLRVLDADLALQPALTVLLLAPEAYLPLRRLAAEFHSAAEGMESAGAILDEIDRAGGSPAWGSLPPPDPGPIRLDDVRIAHPDRSAPTLEGFSLTIEPGEYLALVGPSGVGKSTILGLLLGLLRPDAGRALVGGADLRSLDRDAWLRRIGWLPQDPHLFAGSIGDNVRFGDPDADDARVWRALDRAAAGFVRDLPDGIHTTVGAGGTRLSAGERRRIALARALVREPRILLLDEPTAHLDPLTGFRILDALDGLHAAGATIVIACHRRAAAVVRATRMISLGGEPVR